MKTGDPYLVRFPREFPLKTLADMIEACGYKLTWKAPPYIHGMGMHEVQKVSEYSQTYTEAAAEYDKACACPLAAQAEGD